jgi:hypothetical protein
MVVKLTHRQRYKQIVKLLTSAGPGGLTDSELAEQLPWVEPGKVGQQLSPRRHELVTLGVIRFSGERRTVNKNGRNRRHMLWVLTGKPVPRDASAQVHDLARAKKEKKVRTERIAHIAEDALRSIQQMSDEKGWSSRNDKYNLQRILDQIHNIATEALCSTQN